MNEGIFATRELMVYVERVKGSCHACDLCKDAEERDNEDQEVDPTYINQGDEWDQPVSDRDSCR